MKIPTSVFYPGNHLTDKVAVAIADTLRENKTLSALDLSYNEFGEQGGTSLGLGLVRILPYYTHTLFH